MEIEQLRKDINHLLENVIEHSSRFSDNRAIPSLEISVVLSKISRMQEKLGVLRYLLEEQENEFKNKDETVTSVKEEEPLIVEEEQEVDAEPQIEPNQDQSETLGEHMAHLPITKLMEALTLNDRYLYANEIFEKDMNAFNEMVKAIDNSSSLSDVQIIVNQLKADKDWDEENEHVQSFLSLVERRFL